MTDIRSRSASYRIYLFLLLSALLGGCATFKPSPPPVTVPQIVQMSEEHMPADKIIQRMSDSRTVYRLKASQLADLKSRGVPDAVIDYMQRTYLDAVQRRQALEDWDNWTEDGGWWYGGGPYGWPDEWMY